MLKINLCTHFLITLKKVKIFSSDSKPSGRIEKRRKNYRSKSLNISSLQTDYLNLYSSSGFDRDSERAHDVQTECTFFGDVNHSAENVSKR